ncbi:nuclear pore anchor [Actinidia rufa]|uniref:Nuclear pore anchor n=1 Tax=Actinidia rufa TaxID=165716 RepID=A0A7J0DL54_9ERIC|nr:nuclear pore anchor [Actinidia rufa]
MPLFLSAAEYEQCSHDASLVAEKADAFIGQLYNQLETVKAQADAAAITAEQTLLPSRAEIGKDGEIERLSTEASELHRSKRQLIELLEQKDLEISEKNAVIQSYLNKISSVTGQVLMNASLQSSKAAEKSGGGNMWEVNLTDSAASREARLNEIESELSRSHASSTRLSEEKELIERHNIWLNDELTTKVNSLCEIRKAHSELEADMSSKIADELSLSKDTAAVNEKQYSAEISTEVYLFASIDVLCVSTWGMRFQKVVALFSRFQIFFSILGDYACIGGCMRLVTAEVGFVAKMVSSGGLYGKSITCVHPRRVRLRDQLIVI